MLKVSWLSFLLYHFYNTGMHVCVMHVIPQEFASLWGSSESAGLVLKQVIMYLL